VPYALALATRSQSNDQLARTPLDNSQTPRHEHASSASCRMVGVLPSDTHPTNARVNTKSAISGRAPVVRYRTDNSFGIAYKQMAERTGGADRARL
jgi:hypothetical protein